MTDDMGQRESTIIIGAGPIGLACAISAKRCGIDPLVVDAGAIVNSITGYPTAMVFFTTPELLEIGGHPFVCAGQKPTREEALKYYRGVVRSESLRVRTHTRFTGASRDGDGIRCEFRSESGPATIACDRLVLATGYYDHPNLLGVPGEDLPHVTHYYDEGHLHYRRHAVVVGGRNSAVEAALDLFRSGAKTTLVYRRTMFPPSVKYWMKPDIENRIKAGEITAKLGCQVSSIAPRHVTVRRPGGGEETLRADRVFLLTGYHPDQELFMRVGITLEPDTGRPAINPETLETNVPGVYMAGSITRGLAVSQIFIENGRFDGEKIFGAH